MDTNGSINGCTTVLMELEPNEDTKTNNRTTMYNVYMHITSTNPGRQFSETQKTSILCRLGFSVV